MTITLYRNPDEKIVLDKNIEAVATLVGTLREESEIDNPTIMVEVKQGMTMINFNYFYVEEFDRYYYLDKRNVVNNRLIEITGICDPLMSFNEEIKNTSIIVARSSKEGVWNSYIEDNKAVLYQNEYILKRVKGFKENVFSYKNNPYKYVLAVAGGNASTEIGG